MNSGCPSRLGWVASQDLSWLDGATPVRRLRGRNATKATLSFYRSGDQRVAVKSYEAAPFLVRQVVGRWLIGHEAAAYGQVAGVDGLPRFLGRRGPFALVTEWVDAVPLADRPAAAGGTVLDRVAAILAALHARGVAIGDLHHHDVLVADDGAVWLVDLAAAVWLGERPGRWRRRLFERLRENDLVAVAKLRARSGDGDVEAAVAAIGRGALARYRRQRRLRARWDRVRGKGRREPGASDARGVRRR